MRPELVPNLPNTGVLCLAFSGLALLVSCSSLDRPAPPPIQVKVTVESDPGRPLAGATVVRDAHDLGVTGGDGSVNVPLRGREGDRVDLMVRCPSAEFAAPRPFQVTLHRTADQKVAEYKVQCAPLLRNVVVAVRAENGANLPVMYLDTPCARTDASGAAHCLVRAAPGQTFTIMISTTAERGGENLRPQNPSRSFSVHAQDEVMFFDTKFERERNRVYVPGPVLPKQF